MFLACEKAQQGPGGPGEGGCPAPGEQNRPAGGLIPQFIEEKLGLVKIDVPRWAAYKIAYCGNRYARLAHNGWVHKAISNERLAAFGLVSMSNYYAERRVIC